MSIINLFKKSKEKSSIESIEEIYGHYCILDSNTNGLLVVGKNLQCMNFLKEYTFDTTLVYLPSRNRKDLLFLNSLVDAEMCYLLRWDFGSKTFLKNKNVTASLQKKSSLASIKYKTLEKILLNIVALRNRVKKTLPYQETIYLLKRIQAERFKDRGYPENEMMEYSYVLQYADLEKISLKESADRILFKSNIDSELLAKTELLRLTYFNKLRVAESLEEVENAYEQFLLDFSIKI